MKPQELRANNLISINGSVTKIDHIKPDDSEVSIDKGFYICFKQLDFEIVYETDREDVIKPIPLTRDALETLPAWEFIGFGTRIIYKHMKFNALEIEWCGNNELAFYFNRQLLSFKKYFHELQNLFFDLSGEELTIK